MHKCLVCASFLQGTLKGLESSRAPGDAGLETGLEAVQPHTACGHQQAGSVERAGNERERGSCGGGGQKEVT